MISTAIPVSNNFYVYLHKRNDTGEVFYVGKGKGRRAYVSHGRSSLWTHIAKKHGFTVEIVQSELTEAEAFAGEVEVIKRHAGLCNFTDGGEGISGYRHTEETRKVISSAHSGKKQDPIVVEARTIKLRGKKRSPEFSERMVAILTGRTASPATRVKMSLAHTGQARSAEAVAKAAEWHRGQKRGEESRARMSEAQPKRAVICLCTGEVHRSIEDAAKWLRSNGFEKATKTGVWFSASGRREKSYGYRWAYHESSEPEVARVLRDSVGA